MFVANKTWVCATCGQGVTRKTSGLRHINKLHSGKAMLVRPYVYIAGILSGRFQQSDPSLYRKHTKKEFNNRPAEIVHEEINRYATKARTRPFSNIDDKNPSYSFPIVECGDQIDRPSSADSIGGVIRRKQTLQEIGKLARKYCTSHIADGIIMTAQSMAWLEPPDDESLDTTLEELKKIAGSQPF
jgi:hypothetical protein